MKVTHLFPIPVASDNINRDFTLEESKYFVECSENIEKNRGNYFTKEHYVLDNPAMDSIREFIVDKLNFFAHNIIGYDSNLEFYPTLSWLNYGKPDEWHHKHTHANSIISGVFYIAAPIGAEIITFCKSDVDTWLPIKIATKNTIYSTPCVNFEVGRGDLVLFSSGLSHEVPKNKSDELRISLAFNTFVRGTINSVGHTESLTELRLQ